MNKDTGTNFYAIQVRTGGEEKYIRLFKASHPELQSLPLRFPQRVVRIRRKGRVYKETAPVFSGYLFIGADEEALAEAQRAFRGTDGFFRFLPSNQEIRPLAGRDLETVLYFIRKAGPLAGISKARFDESGRIVVAEGPLFGLAGSIVKVDKRKKWAKVKLDLYKDSFLINLAFDVITPER
ncbi:MAG: antiterminator LoaP [Treponematales bacterium]